MTRRMVHDSALELARHALLATLPVIAALVVVPSLASAQEASPGPEGWYEGLRDLAPDPSRGAEVAGMTIERDAGTLRFDEGQLHALRPIGGRTIGVVFSGSGSFHMAAPEQVETAQLRRVFQSDEVNVPIRSAVLIFTDFTMTELENSLEFGPLEPSRDARNEAEEAREYFTNDDGWVDRTVLLPLVNQDMGFFYAHVSEDRDEPLIFTLDQHAAEEISLARRADGAKRPEVVTRFHRAADYATGRSIPQEALDLLTIREYDISTEIEGNLDVVGHARLSLARRDPAQRWIPFRLFHDFDIDSLLWSDGSAAPFYRPDDSSDLWVDFESAPAEETALSFHYAGDLMDRPQGLWVQLASHNNWYPVYEFGRMIPYHLTFDAPDDLSLTAVGTKTSEVENDGRVVTTWETEPARMVTFNVGDFDLYESEAPTADEPALSVLINESAHRRLADMAMQRGLLILEQENMAEMVAHDLRNSFGFFNEVYGPTTVEDFIATEIPYSHGEAYPGLVMLAWNTFQWTSSEGFDEMFRAHEVAHQWWGISVQPATYRDWWIAEGFSEFSGLWYAARANGSVNMYYDRLEQTREALLERRGRSAPIGLGQRSGSSRAPGDYQMTIYQKSAWVLHMLRTLMTDYDTGSDDAFTRVMQRFYSEHVGGVATTASFQAILEEELGGSMDWFFQQWIYGSDIPTYTFSHTYASTPEGQVVATVRVRQEDVPDDFQMYVPIHLDFGEEGSATVRVLIRGPETTLDLPPLPREPDSIEFNPFESVLAETKTEGWRSQ